MSSLSTSGLEDILVLSFPLNFSFSDSGSRNEMEHLSQHEEGEVTRAEWQKAAGLSPPAAIKDDTVSAGAHGRTFPLLC